MRLSNLQKFILLECLSVKSGRISRGRLNRFYDTISTQSVSIAPGGKKRPKEEIVTKIITKSMERLINKELIVGFGERTPHKWYIKEIRLTPLGKKAAKKLLGEQMKLPFKKQKTINKKQG